MDCSTATFVTAHSAIPMRGGRSTSVPIDVGIALLVQIAAGSLVGRIGRWSGPGRPAADSSRPYAARVARKVAVQHYFSERV